MTNDNATVLSAMRTMEEGYGFNSGGTLKKDEGTRRRSEVSKKVGVAMKNPGILLKALSVLLIVCGAGVATIYFVRNNNIEAAKHQSLTMAQETGDFFCKCVLHHYSSHLYSQNVNSSLLPL